MQKLTLSSLIAALVLAGAFSAGAGIIYEPYTITTIAGWGNNSGSTDGPPDQAEFYNPWATTVDKQGNV
jgi:hypothetical protein